MSKSQRRTRHFSEVGDLYGCRRLVRWFRDGDGYRFGAQDFTERAGTNDVADVPDPEEADTTCVGTHHHAAHYLRILLGAYRSILTDKQFEAAEQIIVLNRGVRAVAAERGGSPEAWRQRIEGTRGCGGLKEKAPGLYALWLFRNRGRRDISEVINAIRRAIARHAAERVHQAAPRTTSR